MMFVACVCGQIFRIARMNARYCSRYGVLFRRYSSNASASSRSHLFALGTEIPIFFAIRVVGTPNDLSCLSSRNCSLEIMDD